MAVHDALPVALVSWRRRTSPLHAGSAQSARINDTHVSPSHSQFGALLNLLHGFALDAAVLPLNIETKVRVPIRCADSNPVAVLIAGVIRAHALPAARSPGEMTQSARTSTAVALPGRDSVA